MLCAHLRPFTIQRVAAARHFLCDRIRSSRHTIFCSHNSNRSLVLLVPSADQYRPTKTTSRPRTSHLRISSPFPPLLSTPFHRHLQGDQLSRPCSSTASSILVKMATDRDILPDNVRPNSYDISLYELQAGPPWSYQGTVKIGLEIKKATQSIVLNTDQLKLHSAELLSESGKTASSIKSSSISYDEKNQRCTIDFDQELPAAPKAVLSIQFEGTMNQSMVGFYRSKYVPTVEASAGVPRDEKHHYMFSTQFESSEARKAFPCFDEPNLKATYDFEIEIPEDLTALSNMPEKETRKSKKAGHKVVSFERTPIMSTYLLAWAFGDFEYVEDFTKRKYSGKTLPVRVYTTRGLKEQGRLALESAPKVIDLFSEVWETSIESLVPC